MHRGSFDFDVFVAGGGPAGLATAIAAAQKGLRVAVADCAEPPVDKACGEGIMPSGVSALGELGVRLPDNGSAKLRGIRFTDAAGEVSAQFNVGFGAGIRRLALHTALVSRALTCGVDLRWRARLEHVTGHEAIVEGQSFRYRYLVGADGQNSRVRESSSFASETVIRRRFGFRRHYALQPWSEYVEVYWSDCGQMYVTPTSANEVCIALLTRDQRLRFDEALPQFPALCECLSGLAPVSRTLGAMTVTRRLSAVCSASTALVGDASGSTDAITGDGLSMAFQQALALAGAMECGDLSRYRREHRRIARAPRLMGELILAMEDHPGLRRRAFRVFNRRPEFFAKLLAIHTREHSPLAFGLGSAVLLGWNLLTA